MGSLRGGQSFYQYRRTHLKNKRKYLAGSVFGILATVGCLALFSVFSRPNVSPNKGIARSLLSEDEKCHAELFPYSYQNNWAVFVFEILGVIYCFIGLAIVCDDYFTDSLEAICEFFDLSEDVAGATFMAAGSSAPELFTSIASSFTPGNPTGLGTIIGSAVFNINVIIGMTAIFAGHVLHLDWRPLTRDCIGYATTTLTLLLLFATGNKQVDWYEALTLLLLYILYVAFMKVNGRVMALCPTKKEKELAALEEKEGELQDRLDATKADNLKPQDSVSKGPEGKYIIGGNGDGSVGNNVHDDEYLSVESTGWSIFSSDSSFSDSLAEASAVDDAPAAAPPPLVGSVNADAGALGEDEESEEENAVVKVCGGIFMVVSFPLAMMFKFSIPDCSNEKFRKFFMVTFAMSVVWIGILSHFMVGWATYLGCKLNVPQIVMGLTVLAAGTSIPDALGSISVAKDGQGDMAIANAIGSNIFDILIGLGAPWMMLNIMNGKPVIIDPTGVPVYVGILFGFLGLFLLMVAPRNWKIDKKTGGLLLVLYLFFCAFGLMTAFPCKTDPIIYLGTDATQPCK